MSLWSSDDIKQIAEVFPEAIFSDVLYPRPSPNPRTKTYGKRRFTEEALLTDQASTVSNSSLVDPAWELIDPLPDIRALFSQFDTTFFDGKLSSVEVRWSPRMTLCAGLCCYEGRGGLCSIRLSEPLLKLRPRSDLVETLLHEMIHAFLFVTQNYRDRESHGPNFQSHMRRINAEAGTHITVYHTFHDEVDNYRTHWWRCTGSCRDKAPFYGFVRRSVNRAPGPNDTWWAQHQATCSGHFIKIKEPENNNKVSRKKVQSSGPSVSVSTPTQDIRPFLTSKENFRSILPSPEPDSQSTLASHSSQKTAVSHNWPKSEGHVLGGTLFSHQSKLLRLDSFSTMTSCIEPNVCAVDEVLLASAPSGETVSCPVCNLPIPSLSINEHLDNCLIAG